MKRLSLKRTPGFLLALCVLSLAPGMLSSAAAGPGFVKIVKAGDVSGTKAVLTWSRASNAAGYNIYKVDTDTGEIIGKKPVATTKSLSCTVAIDAGETSSFQVFAYSQQGSRKVENEEGSPTVDIESKLLRLSCYGNKCAYLEWDKVKNAKGYILYIKEDGEYEEIDRVKKTSYKLDIPVGETYKVVLRSYRKEDGEEILSEKSNVLKVTGKKLESVHGRQWLASLKKSVKVEDEDTGNTVTLKAGTKFLAPWHSYNSIKVTALKGGKKYTIKGTDLKFGDLYLAPSYDYYNSIQAEAYINGKNYKSKTNYLIWISQYTASVHFFKKSGGKWKETRVAPCIIGGVNGHTLVGEYETFLHNNTVHFYWNPTKSWGQAFHGWIDGNRWGSHSKGCVRLEAHDLQYLRRLPLGTKVVSY